MATAGPNSPSAASGWTNSSNVYSSNDVWATDSVSPSSDGNGLLAQGYGFSIPSGATVNGITVVVERHASAAGYVRDVTIQLLNSSGTGVGNNKADTGTFWPASDGTATYGSSSDTWSASLTDTDINSANFGVYVKAHNNGGVTTRTAYVDYVSVTVDYTAAAGQPMQARSRLVPFVNKSRIGW